MSCLKIYFLPLDLPFFRRIFPFCEFRKEASSLIHLVLFCTGKICTIYSAQRLLIKSFTGMCCGPFVQFPPPESIACFRTLFSFSLLCLSVVLHVLCCNGLFNSPFPTVLRGIRSTLVLSVPSQVRPKLAQSITKSKCQVHVPPFSDPLSCAY